MVSIGCYQVQVKTSIFGKENAILLPAEKSDMPSGWDFAWERLLEKTQFDTKGLIKLEFQEKVFGLVRYSLYPHPEEPKYIFIDHIEAIPTSRGERTERLVEPIGKWLIWYAIQVAFSRCSRAVDEDSNLIILEALDSAFDYYRDKIRMRYLGMGGGSGEDVSIFAFSWSEAKVFCANQTKRYGVPLKL